MASKNQVLGSYIPSATLYFDVREVCKSFLSKSFASLTTKDKFTQVCKTLLREIEAIEPPCFLLPTILAYIENVNDKNSTDEPFTIHCFETWLTHWSDLSFDEILYVRGKIAGRYIPREEYQVFFPVGMGKVFSGSHVVAAHLAPDVDTTVASFWGWMDAFACKVAEGTHQWSLPLGLSDGHIQLFFKKVFGDSFFRLVPRELQTTTLSAQDLLTKRKFFKVDLSQPVASIDVTALEHAIVVVDEHGSYVGEWRSHDAEVISHIMSAFQNCLRWFENCCYANLIHVLAKDAPTEDDIKKAYLKPLETHISSCPAIEDVDRKIKSLIDIYLKKIFSLQEGLCSPFSALFVGLDALGICSFAKFLKKCALIYQKNVFADGREKAVKKVEEAILLMEDSFNAVRSYISTFSHVLSIKNSVLEIPLTYVTLKSDVDEMRSKIEHWDHLTVVAHEKRGGSIPVGVVYAEDLRKNILGTASLRDFSSIEETKIASYFDVISIVDHHKTKLSTQSPPTFLIGDTQSSNTLIAEVSLALNAKYGIQLHDYTALQNVLGDIVKLDGKLKKKLLTVMKRPYFEKFFVDKSRELAEYFSYLYAILDDTDLLTKVSRRDVLCVKALLDRMKSLVCDEYTEAVSFESIPPYDVDFVKKAAIALLKSPDLHSIYAHMYRYKEEDVERAITTLLEGRTSSFFLDTKEQNGCCRVGQAKLFCRNVPTFEKHKEDILDQYIAECLKIHKARPHIDFYLEMISTIPSADEACLEGRGPEWAHQDEMWIFTPDDGVAEQHLVWFLNNFSHSPLAKELPMHITCIGPFAQEKSIICKQNFPQAKRGAVLVKKEGPTVVVITYPAGKITSRKAQISPYLPKLVP